MIASEHQVTDLSVYRKQRTEKRPEVGRATIHFERMPDGTYLVTYRGSYATSLTLAAEHLADALHQLTMEIRDACTVPEVKGDS